MAKGDSGILGGMFGGGGKPDPRQGGRSVGWNEVGGQQARFDPSGKMPGSLGGTGFMPGESAGMPTSGWGKQRQMANAGWLGKVASMGQNVGPGSMNLYRPGMPQSAQSPQLQQPPQNTGAFNFPPMDPGMVQTQIGGMNDPRWTNGMPQQRGGFQFPA